MKWLLRFFFRRLVAKKIIELSLSKEPVIYSDTYKINSSKICRNSEIDFAIKTLKKLLKN